MVHSWCALDGRACFFALRICSLRLCVSRTSVDRRGGSHSVTAALDLLSYCLVSLSVECVWRQDFEEELDFGKLFEMRGFIPFVLGCVSLRVLGLAGDLTSMSLLPCVL
jgi:hypothetical protein